MGFVERFVVCFYGDVTKHFNTGFATGSKVTYSNQIVCESKPLETYPTTHEIEQCITDVGYEYKYEYVMVEKRYYPHE